MSVNFVATLGYGTWVNQEEAEKAIAASPEFVAHIFNGLTKETREYYDNDPNNIIDDFDYDLIEKAFPRLEVSFTGNPYYAGISGLLFAVRGTLHAVEDSNPVEIPKPIISADAREELDLVRKHLGVTADPGWWLYTHIS